MVVRCALCGQLLTHASYVSPLAVLTVHWMGEHRTEYLAMHPAAADLI